MRSEIVDLDFLRGIDLNHLTFISQGFRPANSQKPDSQKYAPAHSLDYRRAANMPMVVNRLMSLEYVTSIDVKRRIVTERESIVRMTRQLGSLVVLVVGPRGGHFIHVTTTAETLHEHIYTVIDVAGCLDVQVDI